MSDATESVTPQPRTDGLRGLAGRLTPGVLLIGLAFALMLPLIVRRGGDPDFFSHLRTAQAIIDMGGVPHHELFTYTLSDRTWVDHEYGSELLMFWLPNLIHGMGAISLAYGVLIALGFVFVLLRINLRRTPAAITAAALLFGALVGVGIWGPRSQTVTFTMVCLTLYLIDRYLRRGSRAIYFLPLAVVLWANMHAGFVFGPFLVAVAAGAELILWLVHREQRHHLLAFRGLVIVCGLCLVAGLITPYGPQLYWYVWATQTSKALPLFVAEWQAPDFHQIRFVPFELSLLLLCIGLVFRRPRLHELLMLAVTLLLALFALRNIAIFLAVATPILAWSYADAWHSLGFEARVGPWLRRRAGDLRVLAAMTLVVAVAAMALVVDDQLSGQAAATRANFPVAAMDWLAARPNVGTRMFNSDEWTGYIVYRLYPAASRRVFALGDPTIGGDAYLYQYLDVTELDSDWQKLLDSYGVDYVIFEPSTPLAAALDESSSWQRVYQDDIAAIWLRR
ncbi:MAG: hypothetical protein JOY80_13035 [Candidatus Dormibacteraeota bacterium]|nr:hypothetical protein [Candidatus Dormibacteraeota bacterium]